MQNHRHPCLQIPADDSKFKVLCQALIANSNAVLANCEDRQRIHNLLACPDTASQLNVDELLQILETINRANNTTEKQNKLLAEMETELLETLKLLQQLS